MSKTTGCAHDPPLNGTAQMSTLIPPVDAYASRFCNWYCHRLSRPGCQHELPEQRTGDGGAATASVAGQSARASTTRGIDGPDFIIISPLPFPRALRLG